MMGIFKLRMMVPLIAAAAVFAMPIHGDPAGRRALAIATWMVLAWILEPIHPAIVGFAGCFLFVAADCAEFDVAFGGFGTETPWVVYGGLMLIGSLRASGGVTRLAAAVPRVVSRSLTTAMLILLVAGLAFGMLIDSAAVRAVILLVMALTLAEALHANTRIESRLALAIVASYAAAVLGADGNGAAPPLMWRVVTVAVLILVARVVVRSRERTVTVTPENHDVNPGPVIALLLLTVAVWMTTRVHGVSPGVVGLAAGVAAAFPGIRPGAKGPVADPIALILAGAALSVPLVLDHTKALGLLAAAATDGSIAAYARHLADALVDPRVQTIDGGPVVKLALYQSPALILGAAVAGFTTRDVWRFGAALAAVGVAGMLAF